MGRELAIVDATLPSLPKPKGQISADVLIRIETDIAANIENVVNVSEAEDWRRRAKAIETYLRSPELQKPILGAQRRIEARIGQLLGPGQQGRRTDLELPTDAVEVIKRDTDRADFRLLARALDGECDLEFREWRRSRRALLAIVRQKLGLMPEAAELPAGKFCCIAADPPWQQDTGPDTFGGTGESGHDALAYDQMSVEQICKLTDKGGRSVQDCFADDAHLYLWTINKYVEASYTVARAWGFKPSVLLTWCKPVKGVGLGDTFRLTTEYILFCRRGNLKHRQIIPTTWFQWPRGRHSKKPDEFFDLVEKVTPGPQRLELFSRKERDGWKVWGNEV